MQNDLKSYLIINNTELSPLSEKYSYICTILGFGI